MLYHGWFVAFLIVFSGCAIKNHGFTLVRQSDRKDTFQVDGRCLEKFESYGKLKHDRVISKYFEQLISQLLKVLPMLQDRTITVQLIAGRYFVKPAYSFPKKYIYLSQDWIKFNIKYEAELAALLAVELIALEKGLFFEQGVSMGMIQCRQNCFMLLDQMTAASFFGQNNLFSYEMALVQIAQRAVEVLYHAHFDPRGVSHFYHYQNNPSLLDHIRKAIVQLPPLNNPIVSTRDFEMIQKRI